MASSSSSNPYSSYSKKALEEFWPKQHAKIEQMTMNSYREVNRHSFLPIARIKKIMKIEEGVKTQMISAEAPVLLAKAAELFIEELTLRAWLNTHDNRRKTIQKADVAAGAAKSGEMFDFLIDILPRDESQKNYSNDQQEGSSSDFQKQEDGDGEVEVLPSADDQNVQYILQYSNGEMDDSVMHLENGQVIHATQIGQPIPLSAASGEDISGQPLIMTLPTSQQQNFS